jgi:hypothetical protein
MGFELIRCDSSRLEYRSDGVSVNIGWERRSGELTMLLEERRDGRKVDAFMLEDLLAMQNQVSTLGSRPFQVADEDKLQPFLRQLGDELREHAQPLLVGDAMLFHRLRVFRNTRAQEVLQAMERGKVRSAAEAAWREHDLTTVAALLGSIEGHLSDSEKAKLRYARKHQ